MFVLNFTSDVVHPRIFLLSTFVFAVRFGLRIFIYPPGAVHLCWPESSNNNYIYIYICLYV